MGRSDVHGCACVVQDASPVRRWLFIIFWQRYARLGWAFFLLGAIIAATTLFVTAANRSESSGGGGGGGGGSTVPRNVIVMIGDGFGPNHEGFARSVAYYKRTGSMSSHDGDHRVVNDGRNDMIMTDGVCMGSSHASAGRLPTHDDPWDVAEDPLPLVRMRS